MLTMLEMDILNGDRKERLIEVLNRLVSVELLTFEKFKDNDLIKIADKTRETLLKSLHSEGTQF